jgi:hypothetical protein
MTTPARIEAARFILDEATKLGMRVGTDGSEIILGPPRGMPHETYFCFQDAIRAHYAEVINIIMTEGWPR